MRVVMPLNVPANGSQIMRAVSARTSELQDEYRQEVVDVDGKTFYEIGRSSMHPERDLIIAVGEGFADTRIDPSVRYDSVAVIYHPWPGGKLAGNHTEDDITSAMRAFRDHIQSHIAF